MSIAEAQITDPSPEWVSRSLRYGEDNVYLSNYIESIKYGDMEVEVTEINQKSEGLHKHCTARTQWT